MDRDARVTAATERSQLQPGQAGRIKSCTWPGSDKFMKSSHPHENTVYFNLPSGNKSIWNFCGRRLGLALLLRKDSGICLHQLLHHEVQCLLSKRSLWTHLCVSPSTEPPGQVSKPRKSTSFVIMLKFTNTAVGTAKPVGGRADHPDVCL